MSSDHPVFKRLSRQQLIVRRRHIGYQALTFESPITDPQQCKICGRLLDSIWKHYLCHVCGGWVCRPCSLVVECEREAQRIQFIRSCCGCSGMLNKWSDSDRLLEYAAAPWVVQSSKSQMGLTLADVLRTQKAKRLGVLKILKLLNRAVDINSKTFNSISEDAWAAIDLQTTQHSDEDQCTSVTPDQEMTHQLVQHCFEVSVPELTIEECKFAEEDGIRKYPLVFDMKSGSLLPVVPNEAERIECLSRYNFPGLSLDTADLQLVCELAAKELDGIGFITIIVEDEAHIVIVSDGQANIRINRSKALTTFAVAYDKPFLARDATLDIRLRELELVCSDDPVHFYFGMPILLDKDTTIAALCVVDSHPRKNITTMQYSVVKKLAEIALVFWEEMLSGK